VIVIVILIVIVIVIVIWPPIICVDLRHEGAQVLPFAGGVHDGLKTSSHR